MFHFPQGMPLAMRISRWTLIFGAVSLTVAQTVAAQPPALTAPEVLAERFPNCVQQLQSQALSGAVSQNTVEQVLANDQFTPRVIELDRKQPEFTGYFTRCFFRRVNQQRIDGGRALFDQHRGVVYRFADDYGVQPQYLLSFWGLETSFGTYFGNTR